MSVFNGKFTEYEFTFIVSKYIHSSHCTSEASLLLELTEKVKAKRLIYLKCQRLVMLSETFQISDYLIFTASFNYNKNSC